MGRGMTWLWRLCRDLSQQFTNQRGQWRFVPPVNLLYHTAINVSVDRLIKSRPLFRFISRLAAMGNSHTYRLKRTNSVFYQWKFCPCFWLPSMSHVCTCHYPVEKTTFELFIKMWKNTAWLIVDVRSITATGRQSHMLSWCRRYESLVAVFTLPSEPGLWKANISYTY